MLDQWYPIFEPWVAELHGSFEYHSVGSQQLDSLSLEVQLEGGKGTTPRSKFELGQHSHFIWLAGSLKTEAVGIVCVCVAVHPSLIQISCMRVKPIICGLPHEFNTMSNGTSASPDAVNRYIL